METGTSAGYLDQHNSTIVRLTQGEAPEGDSLLAQLSVGTDFIGDFLRDRYLREFLPAGGSKIKFLTGQPGSGKTHTLHMISMMARQEGFVTIRFSARNTWLHDFKEIYLEILRQSDLDALLASCSRIIIESLGFDPNDIPEGTTFIDYLGQRGQGDALTRREIRLQLRKLFMDNKLLDNNFALACSLLCGGMLGHPFLENQSRMTLLGWLHGDKSIKLAALRPLGLSASRVTKFNARHMLRSLSEVVRFSGHKGLLVCIDNLEVLVDKSSLNPMHYTKMKRDDTYESFRQLIDDIDNFRNIMFLMAFDKALLDNENTGIKSYQALWMRIQNEITSDRINRFSDILDLDAVALQVYSPQMLVEMSRKLAQVVNGIEVQAQPIDERKAMEVLRMARLGGASIPRLVNRMTMETTGGAS
ncbi:MAG: BREX system ATP-binding domain-containing protein [Sphaerochaetaceae bacterium]|jgi:Cdc6-like AAA superfamily ATPase